MLLLTQSVKCVFAKLKLHAQDIVGKNAQTLSVQFFGLAVLIFYLYTCKLQTPLFALWSWSIFWSKLTSSSLRGSQTCFWMTSWAIWRQIFICLSCAIFCWDFFYAFYVSGLSAFCCKNKMSLSNWFTYFWLWAEFKGSQNRFVYGCQVILQSKCNWQVKCHITSEPILDVLKFASWIQDPVNLVALSNKTNSIWTNDMT